MKTNPRRAYLAVLIGITTALISQSALGHELVLTELSSTTLTATYDGLTSRISISSNPSVPDRWAVTVSSASFGLSPLGTGWIEPEDNSLFNTITGISNMQGVSASVEFTSDSNLSFHSPLTDGSTLNNFGTDGLDGGTINLTFNDKSDLPDTGSTLGLLGLALAGLFGATRLRFRQLA